MRTKSIVLLLLALGCGLIASIGISQVIERNRAGAGPTLEYEDVVVAAADIKQGEKLKAAVIELKPLVKGTVPEGSYHSIEEALKNTFKLKTLVLKGEPIILAKFQTKEEDITRRIPHGMRVVSIQADSASAAGNLLSPSDRVDVLLHVPGNGRTQTAVVKTILQNIRVFSVNDNTSSVGDNGESNTEKNTRYVTLLVDPEQAQVLTLAQMQGQIKLSLRGPDDPGTIDVNDPKSVGKVLAENSSLNANSEAAENAALNPLQKASSSLGSFFDTLNAVAEQAQDHQPSSQSTAPGLPYETFQTLIIEGPTPRVFEMSRDKKNPKGTWISDSIKGARSYGTPPSASMIAPETATMTDTFGLPTQPIESSVRNTTF